MPRPTKITIDLTALRHNARCTATMAGSAKLMAAVKADAYGHGLLPCSEALSSIVDGFAVAVCEEAVVLREAGINLPILVLEGPFDGEDVLALGQYDLMSVVHAPHQLDLLEKSGTQNLPSLWIKVDTGMHRLGFDPGELPKIVAELQGQGARPVVITSHFADGENPDSALTVRQQARWQSVHQPTASATGSLANSAGLINRLAPSSEWVRPGIMLYGAAHAKPADAETLRPVMSLTSQVMALRAVPAGESVGYGGRWMTTRASRIATIPVGYGDGYPRSATDGTPVRVGNRICPVAGRVSMDMITVDVTDHPDCEIGTPVELWGQHLLVNEVAQYADTIGYELLTRLTGRTPRNWRS